METVISDVVRELKEFIANFDKELIDTIKKEKPDAVGDLNREMLLEGRANDGALITPKYRNPKYASKKQGMNSRPPKGTPDIKLTGKYHRSLKAKYSTSEITVESSDSKDERLSKKYEGIKGLGPVELEKLGRLILPALQDRLLNKLTVK